MTNANEHRESAAELMAMPLDQLHDLPGCQCPEHQPAGSYDVTAETSPNEGFVPLAAGAGWATANEIARVRSLDLAWHAVRVKIATTGAIAATYIGGELAPAGPVTLADHLAAGIDAILGG